MAKWGGELTQLGLEQAEALGRRLRLSLYPEDPMGLVRLHAAFRHDFKVYSSQEGRCQATAAAFTKGFLDLDGDITPILVSLVERDQYTHKLLDQPMPKKLRTQVKAKIDKLLRAFPDDPAAEEGASAFEERVQLMCPTGHRGLLQSARDIGPQPEQKFKQIVELVNACLERLQERIQRLAGEHHFEFDPGPNDDDDDGEDERVEGPGPHAEPLEEAHLTMQKRDWYSLRRVEHRWKKIIQGFENTKNDLPTFDTSKIPDLWDMVVYDLLRHRTTLGPEETARWEQLLDVLEPLCTWVAVCEFGIDQSEKLHIGCDISWRLAWKILDDLKFMVQKFDAAGRSGAGTSGSVLGTAHRSSTEPLPSVQEEQSSDNLRPIQRPSIDAPSIDSTNKCVSPAFAGEAAQDHLVQRTVSGGSAGQAVNAFPVTGAYPNAAPSPVAKDSKDFSDLKRPSGDRDRDRAASLGVSTVGEVGNGSVAGGSARSEGCWHALPSRKELARMTKIFSEESRAAMRDSSDWHPRLASTVAEITGVKDMTSIVRSRVYSTSASTLHSLYNMLLHGDLVTEKPLLDDAQKRSLDCVTDLGYLSHIVFRCYEPPPSKDGKPEEHLSNYRVEILISPGTDVDLGDEERQKPIGGDKDIITWWEGKSVRKENMSLAPLYTITANVNLQELDDFVTVLFNKTTGEDEDGDGAESSPRGEGGDTEFGID